MILTLFAIISALLVVTSVSTVYSVLWLVTTFIVVSLILGLLNVGFVALLYVIVYVGAIAILFLFVVQLLDLGSIQELGRNNKQSIWPLATIISISIIAILVVNTDFAEDFLSNNSNSSLFDVIDLSLETETIDSLMTVASINHVNVIADWFYGPGLIALIVISLVLLVAMIAPIFLCNNNS